MSRRSHTCSLLSIAASIVLASGCHDPPPLVTDGGPLSDASWSPDAGTPTFTWLYDNVFHPWCSDRNQPCHNPGMNQGVSFSTRDRAFASAQAYVVAGDSYASDLYYLVSAGVMPPILPHVPADLQAALAAWIDAGALDN
jgi:hypothetical protein